MLWSADEKRLHVGGCSGGGVLSSWMIAHTDRFAAAAVRCPVTNWLHHSSLMHVGKVKTPPSS